jgi:hypothetical protein
VIRVSLKAGTWAGLDTPSAYFLRTLIFTLKIPSFTFLFFGEEMVNLISWAMRGIT